jgi:L-seryl-tRNA(Ser) seleniumtransferase
MNDLRSLPSVDQLLQSDSAARLIRVYGRPLTLDAIRQILADVRANHEPGQDVPQIETILAGAEKHITDLLEPTLMPVINATGVVLHTNLGRAPMSASANRALQAAASQFSTLEFDLEKGKRGSRLVHAERLLVKLTGAEAALVVNNNAAAVMLALTALAWRKRVIIARSQLVEIGGGFRVPDVMKLSGARLVEVGTTNRVHASDFEEALQEPGAVLLRAHHSNFQIIGFTSEPSLEELVAVAQRHGAIVMDDLGSGALVDTARYGLTHEPTVQESIQAGVDVVCFSGDKLLGGPQAGIIVGRRDLLAKIKKHQIARAVRADKLALAALSATLMHYLKDEYEREVPVWQMISKPVDAIKQQAVEWQKTLNAGEVIATTSTVGGGSLPGETLPSFALALDIKQPDRFLERLRKLETPVIARIDTNRILVDPRTVLPGQEPALIEGLRKVLSSSNRKSTL